MKGLDDVPLEAANLNPSRLTCAIGHLASAIERLCSPMALLRNHSGTTPLWLMVVSMHKTRLYYKGAHQQIYERFEAVRLADAQALRKRFVFLLRHRERRVRPTRYPSERTTAHLRNHRARTHQPVLCPRKVPERSETHLEKGQNGVKPKIRTGGIRIGRCPSRRKKRWTNLRVDAFPARSGPLAFLFPGDHRPTFNNDRVNGRVAVTSEATDALTRGNVCLCWPDGKRKPQARAPRAKAEWNSNVYFRPSAWRPDWLYRCHCKHNSPAVHHLADSSKPGTNVRDSARAHYASTKY